MWILPSLHSISQSEHDRMKKKMWEREMEKRPGRKEVLLTWVSVGRVAALHSVSSMTAP